MARMQAHINRTNSSFSLNIATCTQENLHLSYLLWWRAHWTGCQSSRQLRRTRSFYGCWVYFKKLYYMTAVHSFACVILIATNDWPLPNCTRLICHVGLDVELCLGCGARGARSNSSKTISACFNDNCHQPRLVRGTYFLFSLISSVGHPIIAGTKMPLVNQLKLWSRDLLLPMMVRSVLRLQNIPH